MSNWQKHTVEEQKQLLSLTAASEGINEVAVEKDWWVSVALKALFQTSCASDLLFKGGTSLSKGWNLIERFSEDIDISIDHTFFGTEPQNNTQLKKLRKKSRKYIHDTLSIELGEQLEKMGITNYQVENITIDGGRSIDTDSDPTVIHLNYESVLESEIPYITPRIKIEISCLSMREPSEEKEISSLIYANYPKQDDEIIFTVKTVSPSRTFLEKIFLLNEEFQKETPRTMRMSRHLYDIEKLMDTDFGKEALSQPTLYEEIVKHRCKYYHLGYVDYQRHHPSLISILPPIKSHKAWVEDYGEMKTNFIYGDTLTYDKLIDRITDLQERISGVKTKDSLID